MCSKVSEKNLSSPEDFVLSLKSSSSFRATWNLILGNLPVEFPFWWLGHLVRFKCPWLSPPRFQCGGGGGAFVVGFATSRTILWCSRVSYSWTQFWCCSPCGIAWSERGHQSPQVKGLSSTRLSPPPNLFSVFHLFTHLENTVLGLESRTFWI